MKLKLLQKNLTIFLSALFLALGMGSMSAQTPTKTELSGNGTFTVPCGVKSITIRAIGGGGAGASSTNSSQGNGGGGGGAYVSQNFTVTPGQILTYSVGTGGTSSQTVGGQVNGSSSTISGGTVNLIAAGGASAATNSLLGGAGGTIALSTGTIRYSGGNGGLGEKQGGTKPPGGGGSSGNMTGNGNPGSTPTGGASAGTYGGAGGNGVDDANGITGGNYGCGGGGTNTQGTNGGKGGNGIIVLEYTAPSAPVITLPSTTPSVCRGQAYSNTLAATNVTSIIATGLPNGLNANLNTGKTAVIISGTIANTFTPGTYNYTITANGCSAATFSGSIIVKPATTVTAASSSPTLCINTALTPITHNTTGAIGISNNGVSGANGLPAGVSASYSANVITISGTPTASGTFNYSIPLTGGCSAVNATGTITVTPAVSAGTVSTTNNSICVGSTSTYTSNGTSGGTWSSSNENIAKVNSSTGVVTGFAPGTANITYSVTGCGGTKTSQLAITVNPNPTFGTITATAASVCEGGTVTISATGLLPSATVTYYYKTSITGNTEYSVSVTSDASGNASYTTDVLPSTADGVVVTVTKATIGSCTTEFTGKTVTLQVGKTTTYNTSGWSNGAPRLIDNAIIAADYTSSTSITACNITVNTGILFTIDASTNATIQNNITNIGTGKIIVKSGGNLLQINPLGTYTGSPENFVVEREATNLSNSSTLYDFVFWSSPVEGQTFADFSPTAKYKREFKESLNKFVNTTDVSFLKGKGYSVWAETTPVGTYDKTYKFTGKPNNGDIDVNVVKTTDGYNLIGNPYPSNIDIKEFLTANAGVIDYAVWRWKTENIVVTPTNGAYVASSNYVLYNGSGTNDPVGSNIVTVGQGFMVQKTTFGGPQSVSFKNSYGSTALRVADAGVFYDKKVSTKDRFWLTLTSPEKIDNSLLIAYVDGATDGYDKDYDGESFTMSSNLFYSLLDDKKLIIQGKSSDFKVEDRIMLGANIYGKGKYTISLAKSEGRFVTAQKIYLLDNKLKTYTDITTESYTFDAEAGMSENRFEIVYQAGALATDNIAKSGLIVYKDGNSFFVRGGKKMKNVEVYDVSGRMIKKVGTSSENVEIPASTWNNGIFILKVDYADGSVQTKKILK